MKREDVVNIYDKDYAEGYNARFLLEPGYKAAAEYEYTVLKGLIRDGSSWLDVGCGTGFFLGKFPGVRRAGLDLSPEMLKVAQRASPDALFFKEGDFRMPNLEWDNKWHLVSSMWGAYVYLDSQQEIEQFLHNITSWVMTGGTLFLPVIDYEDYRPSITIPYFEETFTRDNVSYGRSIIKSFTWDYIEYIGKNHYNLVSLHLEYMIELLSPYFNHIEVHYYPLEEGEKVPRKALIATGKRIQPDPASPAAISRTTPLHSVKTDRKAAAPVIPQQEPAAEQTAPGLSYFIKRLRPLNRGFWKKMYRFITS